MERMTVGCLGGIVDEDGGQEEEIEIEVEMDVQYMAIAAKS